MFSTHPKTNYNFSVMFILSSENAFNLDQSKKSSFGKELRNRFQIWSKIILSPSYVFNFDMSKSLSFCISINLHHLHINSLPRNPDFNPFPNKPWFLRVCCTSLLKTLWEKEKLLVTSNFSFSHSVFYLFGDLSAIFVKFRIVVCQCFEFGRVKN